MGRTLVVVLAVSVWLAACGGDGSPSGFDADPGAIDSELEAALADGTDPEAVPAVQRNFLEGCIKGAGDSIPEMVRLQRQGLIEVCGCGYVGLVDQLRADAVVDLTNAGADATAEAIDREAFERFKDLDDDLRTGEGDLDEALIEVFRTCIRAHSPVNTSG